MMEIAYTKWLLHKARRYGLDMELVGVGLYDIREMRIGALDCLLRMNE